MKLLFVVFFLFTISTLFSQHLDLAIPLDKNNKPVSLLYSQDLDGNFVPVKIDVGGASDINIQDQTTDPIISPFNKMLASTTLSDSTEIDDHFIVLTSMDSVRAGNYIFIFNPDLLRFTHFHVDSVANDTAFIDVPMDVEYPIGSYADITTLEMAIDGSSSVQTFGIRGVSPSPIGISVDITRIIFTMIITDPPEFTDFGDIADGLRHGITLRKRNDRYFNVFNIHDNQELASLMYDVTVYEATKQFLTNAIIARLTFGGQNKVGVVIRLEPGEDLEFLIHDDLSSLISFKCVAEGHIVLP